MRKGFFVRIIKAIRTFLLQSSTACAHCARNMSTTTTTKKRGAPKKKARKTALNLTLNPEIIKRAKQLAFEKGLSLSVWIEQMIRKNTEGDAQ